MAAPIAAINGVKRGKARADRNAGLKRSHKVAASRHETVARAKKEQETIKGCLEKYDTDKTGYFTQDQMKVLLADYNLHLKGRRDNPTQDEIDCLLAICDKEHDGTIAQDELIDAILTWSAYCEKSKDTLALLEKYDLSRTGVINRGELRPLLVELNEGIEVPDDVLEWIWAQADLTGNGTLSQMELTRAIAAWYVLLPHEDQPDGRPYMLGGQMDKESMPKYEEPKTRTCAVQ